MKKDADFQIVSCKIEEMMVATEGNGMWDKEEKGQSEYKLPIYNRKLNCGIYGNDRVSREFKERLQQWAETKLLTST